MTPIAEPSRSTPAATRSAAVGLRETARGDFSGGPNNRAFQFAHHTATSAVSSGRATLRCGVEVTAALILLIALDGDRRVWADDPVAARPPAADAAEPDTAEPGAATDSANDAATKTEAGSDQATTDPAVLGPVLEPVPGAIAKKMFGKTDAADLDVTTPLDGRPGRDLSVRLFRPRQQIERRLQPIASARYTVVDVHTHLFYRLRDNLQSLTDVVQMMDRNNIAACISLDGRLGDQLQSHHAFLKRHFPDRFLVMANVDWVGGGDRSDPATWDCHRAGFADRTADQLRRAAQDNLIVGLKVFKRFGLGYRNPDGSLIKIDDPRFDPIWAACGELNLPILIHTADPAAFFEPIGPTNERWEELVRHPDWSFAGGQFPTRDELLDARNRLIGRHRTTNFICAHVANCSEDLDRVAGWLDRYPNMYVEIASRISELGRKERSAAKFIGRYADRVLFGTDGPWPEARLKSYWRFLETDDESFDYSEKDPPPQGLWRIDGMRLPDEVLQKVYHGNAIKLIPAAGKLVQKFESQNNAAGNHSSDGDSESEDSGSDEVDSVDVR